MWREVLLVAMMSSFLYASLTSGHSDDRLVGYVGQLVFLLLKQEFEKATLSRLY